MALNNNQQHNLLSADRMIKYCDTIADEFLARYNRIRCFVPDHNLTSGMANETILRDFMAEYSAGKYSVGQGFICDPAALNQDTNLVSKQCDIIVYNRDYPLIHSEGDIKVVSPQSVKFFIEVKSNLRRSDLIGRKARSGALENISAAKHVPHMHSVPGLIFAFQSPKVETVINHLRAYPKKLSEEYWPTAILLLDKGVIIHRWSPNDSDMKTFEVRKGDSNEKGIVMAFLVLFYFEKITDGGGAWGGANYVQILKKMLEYRTRSIENLSGFKINELL